MSVIARRVKKLLDRELICYETVPHVTDFTAMETSEHTHTPGGAFAKAVIIRVDVEPAMLVLPADHVVELAEVRQALGRLDVRLASERQIHRIFTDCDRGAIPPFGNLYGLEVYISPSLLDRSTLTFNAGSHEMAIRMSESDYLSIVKPKTLGFSHHI